MGVSWHRVDCSGERNGVDSQNADEITRIDAFVISSPKQPKESIWILSISRNFGLTSTQNRARLNLGSGQTVSIVAGVETGQLVGACNRLKAWPSMPPAVAQNHS